MTAFIIRPKTKKDAEIAEAVLRKMRIPIEKIEQEANLDEEEDVVPFSVFAEELDKRIKKHFNLKASEGIHRKKSTRKNRSD